MKRCLLIFILLFAIKIANSQVVFCPPGADWHYSFFVDLVGLVPAEIKYVRDSVLGAETVKVLQHNKYFKNQNFSSNLKLTLIKQTGDVVFFRNLSTQNTWQILYNFGATAGQSWQNTISLFTTSPGTLTALYNATVDSVNYINLNAFNLRRLYVKYWSQYAYGGFDRVTITERFGCDNFLFNFYNYRWGSDGDQFPTLICYADNAFGSRQLSEKSCNLDNVGIEAYDGQNHRIKVYPNPSNGLFTVSYSGTNPGEELQITVTDVMGREIKRQAFESDNGNCEINLKERCDGIYLLKLTGNKNLLYQGKLVKQDQ